MLDIMDVLDVMDIYEILQYLPQRYPFLMVDRVIAIVPKKSIVVIKNVSINEPYFLGHFPGNPIMPGVLILEAMAQASGILALQAYPKKERIKSLFLFAGIDKVRFKRSVIPGDQLRIEALVKWARQDILKTKVTATVDDELICCAELTGARKQVTRNGDD